MAIDKSTRKKIISIVVLIAFLAVASSLGMNLDEFFPFADSSTESSINTNYSESVQHFKGKMIITMLDVGQADSFLLEQNGITALIDFGTKSTGEDVVKYLKKRGISRLDYVFGTHPHDDHMGGMSEILSNFEIGTIIIPKITKNTITSNWYLSLMKQIKNGKYKVVYPKNGMEFSLGNAKLKVLGPIEEPDSNLNNYSTVIMASFGEMDVLFTGDMESDFEKKLLKSGTNLDAEILKIGHHGSDTSTSNEFLNAVSPDYALISTRIGNKFDHPSESTMLKLKEKQIPVYRTDECGTVIISITSNSVNFSTNPGNYLSGTKLALKEGIKK